MSILFTPITFKDMEVKNRIVMPPMCQYACSNSGIANDWHLVHLASRAVGGVGLIIVEASAIEPRGRISDNDIGIWSDEHIQPLRRIVGVVHDLGAKIGIQLAHAGRKSESLCDTPVAPSPTPFDNNYQTPKELNKEEIKIIQALFASAAKRALEAKFDVIEIHGAHGYLISEFLSPMSNQRMDEYCGSTKNRARFLRETILEVRKEWPGHKPLFVRVSATDYTPQGMHLKETINIISELKDVGVDLWDISSGGVVSSGLQPVETKVFPGYQVRFASRIRQTLGVKTMAVGLITAPELAEHVLSAEHADMIALGRELLRNPYWPLQAASVLGDDIAWPKQYEVAK